MRTGLFKWSAFVVLQGVSALFFIGDILTEIFDDGWGRYTALESMATVALLLGAVFGGIEAVRISQLASHANETLKLAQSEFSELVSTRFAEWSLTSAERDVALLMLKGFDIPEIASFRQTAEGTVRAQLSRIYEKSDLSSRGRFISSFLDVLIPDAVENK